MIKNQLKFTSSWDDGHFMDHQLADILVKHKLPGIFYIPGPPMDAVLIRRLQRDGFEIGAHTHNHPQDMKLLSKDKIVSEILVNRNALELLLDKPVTKFCYPRGRYDERVIEALKQLGFKSARTTKVLQTMVEDPFQTPTSIHVYQRQEYGETDWVQVAERMVEQAIDTNGVFHIWGHSAEIERFSNWEKLDRFFEWLTDNYEIIKV